MIFQAPKPLYKSLFDNALDGLAYCQMVFDEQGHPVDFIYIEVNKSFERITGLKDAEGKKVTELIPDIFASNPDLFQIYGRVSLGGKSERFETYLEQLSKWFLVSVYSPKRNFFLAEFEDITESKRIEKDLEDSRLAAQNVFEDLSAEKTKIGAEMAKEEAILLSIGDGVIVTDEGGNITLVNKTAEKLLGVNSKEAYGKTVDEIVPIEDEGGVLIAADKRPMSVALKTGSSIGSSAYYFVRKDKTRFPVAISVTPVILDGKIIGVVDVFNDISDIKKETERIIKEKEKEDALVKDLEKFKLAVDNASDQIVITDPKGTVIYVNRSVETITGYKPEEVLGKKSGALWKSPMNSDYYQSMWDVIENQKKVFAGEIQNKRKNGLIYTAAVSISPILNKDGGIEFFVGIERDITKEKEIDRAKSEFVSLASHQLRTPPTIIGWYTETLQSGELGPINEKQADYLKEIYKANRRMVSIINSLLNISRIEMGTFEISAKNVNIGDIVDETVKELSSRFNRNVELKRDYDPNLGLFKADPDIMQIIIDNLLSNAFKYSPAEDTKIEITTKKDGDSLILSVKDNGIGIPLKDQSRVFEKLFRADNAVTTNPDGTGLGLYMIKKIIVDGLGGKVWFESEENKGAIFYISLPASGMKEKAGTTTLARII